MKADMMEAMARERRHFRVKKKKEKQKIIKKTIEKGEKESKE
jgi:hypothetical protein